MVIGLWERDPADRKTPVLRVCQGDEKGKPVSTGFRLSHEGEAPEGARYGYRDILRSVSVTVGWTDLVKPEGDSFPVDAIIRGAR